MNIPRFYLLIVVIIAYGMTARAAEPGSGFDDNCRRSRLTTGKWTRRDTHKILTDQRLSKAQKRDRLDRLRRRIGKCDSKLMRDLAVAKNGLEARSPLVEGPGQQPRPRVSRALVCDRA